MSCRRPARRTWRAPIDRHVGGRAARVVVGSDASMPPDTCNLLPFVLACGHFGLGSSLRVPASSLPAASRFILSPGGSADWVAESGALHYRALLSAQTVVGEPPRRLILQQVSTTIVLNPSVAC